ncbi:MAG TPA: hypothetical protein VLF89_01790 [Candidatus Saccharimonadales bacterium]|nr:hypothetical protein [Candidatus Saccharimonadales bacterium]
MAYQEIKGFIDPRSLERGIYEEFDPSLYQFYPGNAPGENHSLRGKSPFLVKETRRTISGINIDPNGWLDESAYLELQALALATTLNKGYFGEKGAHIYYGIEYAADYTNSNLVTEILKRAENKSVKELDILEIGGNGEFAKKNFSDSPYETYYTLVNLDHTRKEEEKKKVSIFRRPSVKLHNLFIQGDAQRLPEIMHTYTLPPQDAVVMLNVENVAFDPIDLMAKAWDCLSEEGGILFIGNMRRLEAPLLVKSQNTALRNRLYIYNSHYPTPEDADEWSIRENWKERHDFFLQTLLKERFQYDSARDEHSPRAIELAQAYDIMPQNYPNYALLKVLEYLCEEYKIPIEKDEPNIPAMAANQYHYVLMRKTKGENPFRRFKASRVVGSVKRDREMLPQILNEISL